MSGNTQRDHPRRSRERRLSPDSDELSHRRHRHPNHRNDDRDIDLRRSNHNRERGEGSRREKRRDYDDDDHYDGARRDHKRRRRSSEKVSPPPTRPRRRSYSPPPASDSDERDRRRHRRDRDDRSKKPSDLPRAPRSPRQALPPQEELAPATAPRRYGGDSKPRAEGAEDDETKVEKQAPNFRPTGLLAAETNRVANTSIVLKYNEPPEARKPPPKDAWRLYVFKPPPQQLPQKQEGKAKGGDAQLVDTIQLGERSCWLMGREGAVVDFMIEHPSCSKQHAVIQFRYAVKTDQWGEKKGSVRYVMQFLVLLLIMRRSSRNGALADQRIPLTTRPYIIDLESANGTIVNGDKIPQSRYVELRDGDMVQFGHSTREYVLMLPPPGS
ncbi:MAG: hypothetical protein M4579_002037 [Chaenotheca gracillima]|nr:MAG: hypothetical protein M4579_002037 [Chaenotheca gracillima]